MESEVSVQRLDDNGAAAGEAQERRERGVWDKPGKRMKWSSPAADPSAYVADAKAGTLMLRNHAFSSTLLSLPAERADDFTTPFPGWLWHPEWIVPATPVSVREDGGALVLVASARHPRREIWLDRNSGCLTRFTETDATGATARDVRLTGWSTSGGVWTPAKVEETIRGRAAGLRRVIVFAGVTVNAPVGGADFLLP